MYNTLHKLTFFQRTYIISKDVYFCGLLELFHISHESCLKQTQYYQMRIQGIKKYTNFIETEKKRVL